MQHVRDFGRYPKASKHVVSRERRLAEKPRKARKEKLLSPEQEAELQALQAEEVMQQVRDFGRCPKENERRSLAERRLAERLRNARKRKRLSPEQESELQVFQQAEMDSRAAARISEAQRPLDPMERFAGESESRITPHRMAKQKEYEAKRRATPHRKGYQKEYEATPHSSAKRKKEFEAERRATSQYKAYQKSILQDNWVLQKKFFLQA